MQASTQQPHATTELKHRATCGEGGIHEGNDVAGPEGEAPDRGVEIHVLIDPDRHVCVGGRIQAHSGKRKILITEDRRPCLLRTYL